VLDEDGNPVQEGQGYLTLTRPWPAMLRTLFHDDERYVETYFSRQGGDRPALGGAEGDGRAVDAR
jgi:acetyl-CoA synthetase